MNINCKLTLTDEQRNILKRRITGKDVKAMVSRKEVCELVNEYVQMLLTEGSPVLTATSHLELHDGELESVVDQLSIEFEEGDDDFAMVVKQNKLLLTRCNRLQHIVDTRVLS